MSQHFIDAFPTLFLPKDLPTMPLAEETNGRRNDRDGVLKCWEDFLAEGDSGISVLSGLASAFVDLHLGGGAEQPKCVVESLEKTNVGGYWGYHVRAQNAAVLIHRETRDKVLFMAWQVQATNRDVTNNVAIHQTFPQVTLRISWEHLVVDIESLVDLASRQQSLAVPSSDKSGESFDETRDVSNPFFVLDVAASSFGGEVIPEEKCFVLDKKMCGEVRYMSSELPWRREPVYAVLKNVLHLVCLREKKSEADYKVFVQRFLTFCLGKIGRCDGVSHSSLVEGSRKIARRLEKLREESLVKSSTIKTLEYELDKVIKGSLERVNLDWARRCGAKNSADFGVPLESMKKGAVHTLPKSGMILNRLSSIGGDISAGKSDMENTDAVCPEEFDRHRQWSPFKVADINRQIHLLANSLTTQFGKAPQDFIGTMHDLSEGILRGFEYVEGGDSPDAVTVALLRLETTLIEVGLGLGAYKETSPFQDDVRSRSEVILVAFTICLIIDKIACKNHPLLSEHKLGVPLIFDNLFLPNLKHRKHLSKVEEYLIVRQKAKGPPTLEASRSEHSFAVKYAERSHAMEKARGEMMNKCRQLQQKKRDEKKEKQMKYDRLMRNVSRKSCSCYYRKYYGRVTCGRCLEEKEAKNISVVFHEKYLPTPRYLQQAVAFELRIPDALACQRDCLIEFARSVCEEKWQGESDFAGYWRNEYNLSPWRSKLSNDNMKLGSKTKKVTQSHYSQGKVCSHPDFVVEHGYGVIAMGPNGPMIDITGWKWDMSLHTTMRVTPGRYYSLRKFFNSYSHSENEVIALKSEASEELSLREFEEVGYLRADGLALQLCRLLAGLQQHVYSLDRNEIVSLFSCVLWQVGPRQYASPGTLLDFFRKSGLILRPQQNFSMNMCHMLRSPGTLLDFFRKSGLILRPQQNFSMNMCNMLREIIANFSMNWSNHNALLSVVHIGRHLHEHAIACGNSDASMECAKILRECRSIAIDWIRTLQEKLNQCTDDNARQSYRQRIVDISAMGTLTFLDFEDLLSDADDVHHWGFLRAVFHDNYVPNEMLEPSWRRPHLLHCMQVAENVAPRLRATLESEEGRAGLSRFLCIYWTASQGGKFLSPWTRHIDSSHWYFVQFELNGVRKLIQFDIVGGSFLVDGSPCARLPKVICASKIYRRLFDNAIFLVQPLGKNAYRTNCPVNGFHFEFYSNSFNQTIGFADNPIIIKERAQSHHISRPERAVLVPHTLLNGDFPEILTRDYSHWFVLNSEQEKHSNNMYFRPLKYTNRRMSLQFEKDDFVLHYSEKLLVEQMSGAFFLDINSAHFKKLYCSVFCRLSPPQFVHVKQLSDKITIELPRLNHLSFDYDGKSIQTRQIGGLEVARDQNSGVFIGLEHGLLLEDPKGLADKVFLCPHGTISRSGQKISVDTKTVMNPPLFKYNLRSELRDLKLIGQGRLGWLFLALLHGRTGDLKPDPFTGCTGTKRALDILRLGFSQGNLVTSTDEETLRELLVPEMKLLGKIAELSMGREDYHDMEKVAIGSSPPLCAHDGFALLASQRMDSLMGALRLVGKANLLRKEYNEITKGCFSARKGPLVEKSYFQRRKHYPTDSCLTKEEEMALSIKHAVVSGGDDASPLGQSGVEAIQKVGFAAQNDETLPFHQPSLQALLDNKKEVVGCQNEDLAGNVVLFFDNLIKSRKDRDNNSDKDEKVAFHDMWLQLYMMARCECHQTRRGRILFGSLVTFVAVHYPEMHGYIHQLILVIKHPQMFPIPPRHQMYKLTNEVDFVKSHVDELIDLESFSKAEPNCPRHPTRNEEQRYENEMVRWEYEKDQHARVSQNTIDNLQSNILKSFRKDGYVNRADVDLPHVRNIYKLVKKLQGLFDRWRQSKELKLFREKVAKQLDGLEQLRFSTVPNMLVRIETRPWPKRSFELTTYSSTAVPIESNFQHLLETISISGQYEDAYECDIHILSSSKMKVSPFSFLPADLHPSEAALCKKLATGLQESVRGALSLPDQSYRSFEDSRVVEDMYLDLIYYKERAMQTMENIWRLLNKVKKSTYSILPSVGLWDSTTPWNVLSHHFKPSNMNELKSELGIPFTKFSEHHITNAYAVMVKHVQRARRCASLLGRGNAAYTQLAHDIISQGCAGWTPKGYPEFLAFEVDNDICIREQQAQVAIEILRNDLGNRLLQMNMGCGKSSVIMPLVLCTAADGNSIARGTVLTSLYSTNTADWQGKVGGLLARQIFPLVCCRDMDLDVRQASTLKNHLTIIRDGRHLLVTVPEHRLSLENKAIEMCIKGERTLGRCLLEVIHMLAVHARDFVDESDEIASPKYQLVYPLGSPEDMDGAQIRWLLHAAVLQSVSRHAEVLVEKYGAGAVEIVEMGHDHQYSAIRLLDGLQLNEAYNDLCHWILEDILKDIVPWKNGLKLMMTLHERTIFKQCTLGEEIREEDLASLKSAKLLYSALTLRGLLSHEILLLVLKKRVRVEYGSHPVRTNYQMAVPFRFKDVAAERTDFAHPDVCLGLTFATYYQCGLSEIQLLDVFRRLSRMSDAAAHYSRWTEGMSAIGNLRSYSAINLDDQMLFKQKVCPAFRKHVGVIDFWLLKMIFPTQAKQYEAKITSTAVDLFKSKDLVPPCNSITTGFSGTDDLSLVLPPTVQQKNLEALSTTNGVQLLNILRPENKVYYPLRAQEASRETSECEFSTERILMLLRETESMTNVVLDAGALVLHMSNEQFARAWLKQRTDCDACVFFIKDRIVLISRHDETRIMPFSGSQFENDMSKALLYLDDEHTRGSDFKLPLNARALVTLGKGMNKDKFVQACMRMRQIGKGQQLAFVASNDVHLELERYPVESRSGVSRLSCIINWTLKNTSRRICDLVPYFVSQAICSMQKSSALQQHYYKGNSTPSANDEDLVALANSCMDMEQLKLMDMYIYPRGQKTLLDLAEGRLGNQKSWKLGSTILDRVQNIAPGAKRYCSLHDEEQEVEREQELDEERQVERPPQAKPLPSSVSPELREYFRGHHVDQAISSSAGAHHYFSNTLGFKPLSHYFRDAKVASEIGDQLDESMVFVTSDFIKSVKGNNDKTFYLKRFRWIVRPTCNGVSVALLISNHEAEFFHLKLMGGAIESFVPIVRYGQLHLSVSDPESLPAELHVFGGSINASAPVLTSIKRCLGLHPSQTSEWNRLFGLGEIEVDGFVPPSKRQGVLVGCPFRNSPVNFLVLFLANARHLGGEMRTSVFGQMIDMSEKDLETNY